MARPNKAPGRKNIARLELLDADYRNARGKVNFRESREEYQRKVSRPRFRRLEFVAKADTAPSIPVLVQEFAIPKSSLFNLLATLVDREYLQFVNQDRSRYQLGPRIVELAQIMRRPEIMIERTRPLLKHLSNSPKETSGMSLLLVEHDMEFVMNLVDRIVEAAK